MKKLLLMHCLALMPAFSFAGGFSILSEHLHVADEMMQEEGNEEIIAAPLARLRITDEMMQEESRDTGNQTVNGVLMAAVESNQCETVEFLINAGADLHAEEDAPFRSACEHGHTELARYLLSRGAHMHAVHDDALLSAAKNGHPDTVQFLLDQGRITDQDEIADIKKNQAFIDTVNGAKEINDPTKHIATLEILLSSGADIHAYNNRAIRLAIDNGDDAIINFLFANSASR